MVINYFYMLSKVNKIGLPTILHLKIHLIVYKEIYLVRCCLDLNL